MRAAPRPASSPAATTSGGLVEFLERVYWTADDAGFLQLAAAIAFHVLLAIGPLVVVILAAAGFFFGDEAVQGRLFGELAGLTGAGGASFIQDVVARSAGQGQGIAAAVGSFMFLWTASGVFAQVSLALNNINRVANGQRPVVVPPKEASWRQKLADTGWSFLRSRFAAVLMIVVIVALLVTSLIASSVISVSEARGERGASGMARFVS